MGRARARRGRQRDSQETRCGKGLPHGTGRSSGSRPSSRRPTRPAGPSGRSIGSSRPGAARPGCTRCARRTDRTLIRRVTFDLIGLPPTPEEVAEFLADESTGRLRPGRRPTARLAALRRALGPALDGRRPLRRHRRRQRRLSRPGGGPLSRLHHRLVQPRQAVSTSSSASNWPATSWPARGAPHDYAESVVATGFLALSRRYATAPFELWHLTLEDTIETTGRAFLGLTLRCARCHDHKFDPVTQRDYYALYGIFASTTFPYAGSEELQSKGFPRMNFVPLVEPARAEARARRRIGSDSPSSIATIKALESKKDPIVGATAGRACKPS